MKVITKLTILSVPALYYRGDHRAGEDAGLAGTGLRNIGHKQDVENPLSLYHPRSCGIRRRAFGDSRIRVWQTGSDIRETRACLRVIKEQLFRPELNLFCNKGNEKRNGVDLTICYNLFNALQGNKRSGEQAGKRRFVSCLLALIGSKEGTV